MILSSGMYVQYQSHEMIPLVFGQDQRRTWVVSNRLLILLIIDSILMIAQLVSRGFISRKWCMFFSFLLTGSSTRAPIRIAF